MKYLIIFLLPLLTFGTTLVNKEGKTIEAENLTYDGEFLSAIINGRPLKFSPEILSAESWAAVQKEMTENFKVNVFCKEDRVREDGYEFSKKVTVDVTSTTYFAQEIEVEVYYFLGDIMICKDVFKHKIRHDERFYKNVKFSIKRLSSEPLKYWISTEQNNLEQEWFNENINVLIVVKKGDKIIGDYSKFPAAQNYLRKANSKKGDSKKIEFQF